MKAMILAAGFGTRLLPLTRFYPKPLLPVLNIPAISYCMDLLNKAGITDICINLHHLPEQLTSFLEAAWSSKIILTYSHETEILGTGGALKRVREFLSGDPFLLINADVIIDIDIKSVCKIHRDRGMPVTLVVRKDPDAKKYGMLGLNEKQEIIQILNSNPSGNVPLIDTMFTGIHVLEPDVLSWLPETAEKFDIIRDVYIPMIEKGYKFNGYIHGGFWADIGTPKRYLDVNVRLLNQWFKGNYIPPGPMNSTTKEFNPYAEKNIRIVQPVIIGSNCSLGAYSTLGPHVIVGNDSSIGHHTNVVNSLILPGTSVQNNTSLQNCIAFRELLIQPR